MKSNEKKAKSKRICVDDIKVTVHIPDKISERVSSPWMTLLMCWVLESTAPTSLSEAGKWGVFASEDSTKSPKTRWKRILQLKFY